MLTTDLYPHFQRHGPSSTIEIGQDHNYLIRLSDLMLLLEGGVMAVPEIALRDLSQRSKSDRSAAVVTTVQVVYFVVLTLGRLASGLPISILEVSTLAFIFCAVFIQFFWWHNRSTYAALRLCN